MNALNETTALQIASGQVIINLASVVKELLENALDAGATSMEIRLQDSGTQCIEVSDNGHGIMQNDFNLLCKRNHTSKLSSLEELASVASFGFRGEALSSLCALSEHLCVVTRHTTAAYAHRLEFDGGGNVVKQTKQARTPGTTVQVRNLFYSIPVRRREFTTNSRLELSRMLNMLYSYAVGMQSVKLLCTNTVERSSNSVLLQSFGHPRLSENVATVFGQPLLTTLIEFKQAATSASLELPNELCEEFSLSIEEVTKNADMFHIDGLISSCEHGSGQSNRDRQYLFLNRRPSKIPSLTNVINQTYRQFNAHQYPFVALNISAPREDIDINVTPSKNEVLLKKERLLLYYVKSSLLEVYNNMPLNLRYSRPSAVMNFAAHSDPAGRNHVVETLPVSKQSQLPSGWTASPDPTASLIRVDGVQQLPPHSPPRRQSVPADASPKSLRKTPAKSNARNSSTDEPSLLSGCINFGSDDARAQYDSNFGSLGGASPAKMRSPRKQNRSGDAAPFSHMLNNSGGGGRSGSVNLDNVLNSSDMQAESIAGDLISFASRSPSTLRGDPRMSDAQNFLSPPSAAEQLVKKSVEPFNQYAAASSPSRVPKRLPSVIIDGENESNIAAAAVTADKPLAKLRLIQKPTTIPLRSDILRKCNEMKTFPVCKVTAASPSAGTTSSSQNTTARADVRNAETVDDDADRRFDAQITPSQNDKAEQELRLFIKPCDFMQMRILGQFNRGFIIACLNNEHIFVIDQHASDERYQLELLQRYPRLEGQQLLQPQPLSSLTTADELLIRHRIGTLEKFGFVFANSEVTSSDAAAETQLAKRLMLVKAPVFEGCVLGCDDVRDIATLLLDPAASNSSGSDRDPLPRYPPKLEKLFANRACKRAVKIGMHLKTDEMRRVVQQLAECREPWKCAHGRPTIRHLLALSHLDECHGGASKSDTLLNLPSDAALPAQSARDIGADLAAEAAEQQKKESSTTFYTENIVRTMSSFDSTYFTCQTTLQVKSWLWSAE